MGGGNGDTERLILDALTTRQAMTMEGLVRLLPELGWNSIFQAVDSLSRCGHIALRRRGFDYELAMPAIASQSTSSPA